MKKQPSHILYLITKSNFGGAQRYLYDLATNLPPSDWQVTVALGGEGTLATKLTEAGIRTIPLPHLERDVRFGSDVRVFFALVALFQRERPDVIHLNSSKIGALGALAGRIARVPRIVFTAHGWAFNEERNFFSKLVIRLIHALTVLFCHQTIVVADRLARQLPFPKMTTIHNGIGKQTTLAPALARETLSSHLTLTPRDDRIWIGTIGELHTNKGYRYAIEAMARLERRYPALTYIIIGEGENRPYLEHLIEKHHLENTVYLAGHHDNAAQLLPAFNIFLLPSITEALPYVLLEAGKAAKTTVATRVGGIPEIITHKISGHLVSPRSATQIAEALEALIEHDAVRAHLGSTLKETIDTRFSLQKMVEDTIAVYKKQ